MHAAFLSRNTSITYSVGFFHCNARLLELDMSDVLFSLDNHLQVVQSGGKNIELAVIRRNQPLKVISRSRNILKLVGNSLVHISQYAECYCFHWGFFIFCFIYLV